MRFCGAPIALALWAGAAHAVAAQPPQTLLWLWDRPQLFAALPDGVGAAYLQATVQLSGMQSRTTLRQWPLRIAPGTTLIPVVHVAFDNLAPSPIDEAQQQAIADAVVQAAQHNRSGWVQLDFEARRSQRAGYVAVLRKLQPLRPGVKLSVTALASWCMGDAWLPASLVDEIVPMYFRMGRDKASIRQRLDAQGAPAVAACRSAGGVLLGEAWPLPTGTQRRYVFHARPWKSADFPSIDTTTPR